MDMLTDSDSSQESDLGQMMEAEASWASLKLEAKGEARDIRTGFSWDHASIKVWTLLRVTMAEDY